MVTKRAPFITKPYSAYFHREVPDDDEPLTRVGPGTPMGEYLRRFWQPIAYSHELKDLPLKVRRFGEDLVLFRDKSGHIGLLELHCNHRGTSLEYGKIEEHGIRCCYHGWLFDVDGRILETPLEPPDSTLKDRLCHGAYAVTEYSGMVFAYLGPPDKMPEFPIYDLFEHEGYTMECGEITGMGNPKPCNWLQVVDNLVDPMHEEVIHATISGLQFIDKNRRLVEELAIIGEGEFVDSPTGIITLDMRRVRDAVWVRNIEYVWPNLAFLSTPPAFPVEFGPDEKEIHEIPHVAFWVVPVDDTNSLEYTLSRTPIGQPSTRQEYRGPGGVANAGGRTLEQQQRFPGDYEAQIGQRLIARHGLEHLGVSDRGVTMMRKGIRRGSRAVQQGEDPREGQKPSGIVPTYGGDTMLNVPPATTEEEDIKLLRKLGRDLAHKYLKNPPNQNVS